MLTILNYQVSLGILLLSLLALIEEIMQQMIPNRTFSLVDFGASFLGIFIFYWVGEISFPPSTK